jgi:hypothetical protein
MRTYDSGYLQIILLLVFVVIAFLFLLTQQNTLKAVKPENRLMQPGLVWLQLIPLFGQIWQFRVVTRIADSIVKQRMSFAEDSIVGLADYTAAEDAGQRPTYGMGIIYCTLLLIDMALSVLPDKLPLIQGPVALTMMTCWIIYWVRLAAEKKKLTRLAV